MEQSLQHNQKRPVPFEWGFIGLFVLYVAIFVGMIQLNSGAMVAFRKFTASAIAYVWKVFSVPVVCTGTKLTFAAFPMEIVLECTSLHYIIIFAAGVLAYRSHTIFYRIAGVAGGVLLIFLLNIFRIGVVGFIGRYFNSAFEFVHDYLWQGLFALVVVLIWALWSNGRYRFSRRSLRVLAIVSVTAFLSFWLASILMEEYIALLSSVMNIVFPLMSPFMDVPRQVVAEGRYIGYVVGNEVIRSETSFYLLNAALLLPIGALTYDRLRKKIFLKRLCAVALLLGVQHILIITLDWLLEVIGGPAIQSVIVWCIVMSTFIAPMLAWLAALKIFPSQSSPETET